MVAAPRVAPLREERALLGVKGIFTLCAAIFAAVALVSGSSAGTTHARKVTRIDVSSRTAVVHYLRSIHVNPRGAVIQRGAHNYAGARCPGKGWSCTSTRHVVVQVAARGGKNTFACSTSSCTVVQVAAALAAPNTAKCIKTTGLSSSCTISQTSSTADNVAIVYQSSSKLTGLTQTASYAASITQKATGATNKNRACVYQAVTIDGSTGKGTPISVNLAAHQSATITQDSANGGNSAQESATSLGACTGAALTQAQTLSSTATGSGPITQNLNSVDSGANVTLDIKQNQSAGFYGTAHGPNNATFSQTNSLQAIANTPAGPVSQTQSSTNGGLLATVNQDSRQVSTADATQVETQCEDAHTTAFSTCTHPSGVDSLPYSVTQTQIGPVRKGAGPSTQTGNEGGIPMDTFDIHQSSTQDNDKGGTGQTNTVQADCTTTGNCTATQTTNVDGQSSTNVQSGSSVNTSTNCTGSTCTPTVPPTPTITSSPPNSSNSSSATFTFTDSDPTATFLCKLDAELSYSSCSSPKTYTGLADGSHTFSVKANDTNGNESAPASYTWTIDTSCSSASCPTFTEVGSQLTAANVDVVESGYGGMRGDGTGSISVSGVTGTVLKALLYWNGPTMSSDPYANAAVRFGGAPLTGINIGIASSNCWGGNQGPFTNSHSYRADVTSLVTGDGSYSLANFTKPTADINGVALVVFYNDGSVSNDRNVVLWSGNDSNFAQAPDPQGWDETLTGVQYPGAGAASLDLVVSDGQTFSDDALVLSGGNGSRYLVPSGNIFQGDSTPHGASYNNGYLWDIKSFDITSDLGSGSNTLQLTTGLGGDCLSLVVAAANTPVSAPVVVIGGPATAVTQQSSTIQSAPATAPRRTSTGPGGTTKR